MQVKKKMTCEEFIRNNRGINGGADLPHPFLRELYASISQNEIRISADQQASGLVLASPVLWTDLAQQAQSPRGTFFRAEGVVSLTSARCIWNASKYTCSSLYSLTKCQLKSGPTTPAVFSCPAQRRQHTPTANSRQHRSPGQHRHNILERQTGIRLDALDSWNGCSVNPSAHAGDLQRVERQMFMLLWGPTIAAVSVILDHAEDTAIVRQALDSILLCARIASCHRLDEV